MRASPRLGVFGLVAVASLCGCAARPAPLAGGDRVDSSQKPAPFGPCVDAAEDARGRLAASGEGLRTLELDLDGDGVVDPMVTHASACGSGGCVFELYVARGACASWVGELFGDRPRPLAATHAGLVDLVVVQSSGCAGMERVEVRARFDGKRYLPFETRACHCPERPPAAAAADASCDAWHPPLEKTP